MNKVFYLCNGKNPNCNYLEGCYVYSGPLMATYCCQHTTNIQYAKNILCQDPQNHPERFEFDKNGDYFEKKMESKNEKSS